MIDTTPGKRIEHLVCQDCKDKLVREMAKLSKFDLLRPAKVASKFQSLLCGSCRAKVLREMRQ